ncbi:MAG: hypothetical protein IPH97_10440 [Ignavibacteriales bacterium]|nr:hypothetical protein [Ignavibacteriales bacterium]
MRLEQVKVSKAATKNQSIIWQVLAENNFEIEIIDFIDRFFEIETTKELDGILTIIDNETVYHSIFIKHNFNDPEFIDIVALGYINEKGGVLSTKPIYKCLEKLKEFSLIPSSKSGITFSKKTFSEFYK